MKSIVHEASTIGKAIEQGWNKAGKPQEFSVRILEEPEWNFLGMTTRSAKVALYFSDKTPTKKEPVVNARPTPAAKQAPEEKTVPQPRREAAVRPAPIERPEQQKIVRPTPKPLGHQENIVNAEKKNVRPRREPQWNNELIEYARTWLSQTLSLIDLDQPFKIEPQHFYLRITFAQPVLPEHDRERKLFAGLAMLLIETLKRTHKIGLRGHKIIITHGS